jgi:U3 small nucleolar RNA-associated protein 15
MQDSLHLVSGSDDGRCCYWDMTAGTAVAHFGEHTDNVKRVAASPISPHVFASGSYDHTVKLWDARQSSGAASTFTLTHDAPVEELLWLPAGSLLLAASGNVCRVHDLLAGGRVVHEFSSHQKNVSAITLDGTATRILTADLSGLVKVHHAHTFEVVHGFRYNAPVTSIALSQDNKKLVAGMVDGSLSIRTRKLKASEEEEDETEEFATIRRNRSAKPAATSVTAAATAAGAAGAQNDVTVEAQRRARLKPYEKSLKKFKYDRCDCVNCLRGAQRIDDPLCLRRYRCCCCCCCWHSLCDAGTRRHSITHWPRATRSWW